MTKEIAAQKDSKIQVVAESGHGKNSDEIPPLAIVSFIAIGGTATGIFEDPTVLLAGIVAGALGMGKDIWKSEKLTRKYMKVIERHLNIPFGRKEMAAAFRSTMYYQMIGGKAFPIGCLDEASASEVYIVTPSALRKLTRKTPMDSWDESLKDAKVLYSLKKAPNKEEPAVPSD